MAQREDIGAEAAKACIERVLGVHVELLDRRREPGLPDLFYNENGLRVIVEVKQIVNPSCMSLAKASSGVGYTRNARLARVWTISLEWDGSVNRATVEIVDLLVALESIDFNYGGRDSLFRIDQNLYGIARRLRVEYVNSVHPTDKHPPGYYLNPAGWGGGVPETSMLVEYVESTLRGSHMEKLRIQLGRGLIDADERHAFLMVGLTDLMHVPLTSEADGELPKNEPSLPEPVDGIWLTSDRSNARIVSWQPNRGWFEMPAPWRSS